MPEIFNNKSRKMITRLVLLAFIASFVTIIFFGYNLTYGEEKMLKTSIDSARSDARDSAKNVSETLMVLSDISQSIAVDLSSGQLKEEHIEDRLYDTINSNPGIFGVGVAYEKNASLHSENTSKPLYAPTYSRKNGEPQLYQASYDYTLEYEGSESGPNTEWYHRALTEGEGWNEPYFGTRSNRYIVEFSTPFNSSYADMKDISPAGVVYASYSLEDLREIIGSLDLGDTGYGFIVSKNSEVISHPIESYSCKNTADISETDNVFCQITSDISPGAVSTVYENESGNKLWVFYEEIPSTDLVLGVVLKDEEVLHQMIQEQYDQKIYLSLGLLVFLTSLATLFFIRNGINTRSLWIIAIIFSILCSIEIGFVWNLAMNNSISEDADEIVIHDESGLESSLEKMYLSERTGNKIDDDLIFKVPTGLFIQSIEFETGNDLLVTGYVWQRHTDDLDNDNVPGIIFPESESTSISKAYEKDNVTGWYFETILREQFDYVNYPFDVETVWIRLWSDGFENNVVLVPDLKAYDSLIPESKPGIEEDFVLEGWNIEKSYYSYRLNDYNANFGIDGYNDNPNPDMYYNIQVKRNIITPFITYMSPLLLIALLLFIGLFTDIKADSDPSEILKYGASLVLVLMLAHISLRQSLATSGIIYLEYFYIIMYFMVLGISLDALLFSSEKEIPLLDHQDNAFAKIMYWPMILSLVLLVTLITFI